MCLSISDGSTEVEEQIRSMWEVSTQTLASLMALRRRVTTTHAKMGMLLREASIGPFQLRAEEEIAKLILSGVKSHRQRLENHFGIWCMTWIQNLQSLALPNYRSIVIGNTDIVPPPTNHQQELDLEMILVMEEAIGCYSLELAARELEESNH